MNCWSCSSDARTEIDHRADEYGGVRRQTSATCSPSHLPEATVTHAGLSLYTAAVDEHPSGSP